MAFASRIRSGPASSASCFPSQPRLDPEPRSVQLSTLCAKAMFATRSEFGPDAASAGGLMASLVGTGRSSADRSQSPMVGSLGAARVRVQPNSSRGAEMACIQSCRLLMRPLLRAAKRSACSMKRPWRTYLRTSAFAPLVVIHYGSWYCRVCGQPAGDPPSQPGWRPPA